MAAIDYGAIALKNNKLISHEDYMDPMEMVGWEDEKKLHQIGFIGNEHITVAFGRASFYIFVDKEQVFDKYLTGNFIGWERYENVYCIGENPDGTYKGFIDIRIDRCKGGHFRADVKFYDGKWDLIPGEKYVVWFGYGVDHDYYLRSGKPNLYWSPKFRFQEWRRDMKWALEDALRLQYARTPFGWRLKKLFFTFIGRW